MKLNQLSDSGRQDSLRQQVERSQEQVKARYQNQIDGLNKEMKSLSLELSKSLGSRDKDVEQAYAKTAFATIAPNGRDLHVWWRAFEQAFDTVLGQVEVSRITALAIDGTS